VIWPSCSLPPRHPATFVVGFVAALAWVTVLAQGELPTPSESSPASRHAEVIAHGAAAMPAAAIGWQVTAEHAPPPGRPVAAARPAGFILAQRGALAVTDGRGELLARLAPGEAVWTAPGSPRAVASLERDPVDAIDITLLPAAARASADRGTATGAPFAAPAGEVFDVDLLRDVLQRDEETSVPAGSAPALLLVTDGSVFVAPASGETAQVAKGGVAQISGDVVITGASRGPAAFVVARIGAALPAHIGLGEQGPHATPVATPVASPAAIDTLDTDLDTDGDGLPDAREIALGTDPHNPDSDADGLTDGDEIDFYGTEPLAPDTDGDGLSDAQELVSYGTNPFLADTDGDGAADADEIAAGTDPLDFAIAPATATPAPTATPTLAPSASPPAATPPEALPAVATPAASRAPDGDLDGDGLSTSAEVGIYGTNPTVADSDGDGIADGKEVAAGTDPLARAAS
jgi:hypothetical protein